MKSKKHAYLIIAHDKRHQLEQLLGLLDDERNDIYLLVDSKGTIGTEGLTVTKSALHIIPPMQINWAGYTFMEAILRLVKAAACAEEYHYYHLLSGVDLPLVNQTVIHDFLEDSDLEYIDFEPENKLFAHFKVGYYHYFVDTKLYRKYLGVRILGHALVKLQAILGVDRTRNPKLDLYHGSNWFSITHEFARYVLQQEAMIKNVYHLTLSANEVYLQTMIMDSAFKDKLYDCGSGKKQNLRLIDWKRRNKNSPYTFRITDLDELKQSSECAFFARKFDENLDGEIINAIVNRLKANNCL
ncbi:MAG TPA: beta-1,6-N-acetylglucosaminyltransferase [Bacteroidota bacterium]|nr:beta-1,6-N-acetylglucosaminyltransferase [Bacteroidota bacterium]